MPLLMCSVRRPRNASPDRSDHRVTLNVGGCIYRTSLDTLCCVSGSRFSGMLEDVTQTQTGWQLCIDRNGQVASKACHVRFLCVPRVCRSIHPLKYAGVWLHLGLPASD